VEGGETDRQGRGEQAGTYVHLQACLHLWTFVLPISLLFVLFTLACLIGLLGTQARILLSGNMGNMAALMSA